VTDLRFSPFVFRFAPLLANYSPKGSGVPTEAQTQVTQLLDAAAAGDTLATDRRTGARSAMNCR
jgi:hypothetical protein